ncbi:MAG: DUF1573 domain-containing protein [Bacteroidetes bacterium]|nr:DUF1573 domain-containing protein [Bacteroidota bacterium]
MKYKLLIVNCSLLIAMFACNSAPKQQQQEDAVQVHNDSLPLTKMKFARTDFDFGKITDGEVVEYTYTFTNTGAHDLFLREVKPSCGCTTPDFTKNAIKPGEQGKITVKFDSKGRVGNQNKHINVMANTEPTLTVLRFTAQVLENK